MNNWRRIKWRWNGWTQWYTGYVDPDTVHLDKFAISRFTDGMSRLEVLHSAIEWKWDD